MKLYKYFIIAITICFVHCADEPLSPDINDTCIEGYKSQYKEDFAVQPQQRLRSGKTCNGCQFEDVITSKGSKVGICCDGKSIEESSPPVICI